VQPSFSPPRVASLSLVGECLVISRQGGGEEAILAWFTGLFSAEGVWICASGRIVELEGSGIRRCEVLATRGRRGSSGDVELNVLI
jgi:hypothetical protein